MIALHLQPTEKNLFDLIWSENVDRRLNAAIDLDRSTRAAVDTLSNLLSAYLNNSTGRTQTRLIRDTAETLHYLTGLLVELETTWNVRLPALLDPSEPQMRD